MQAVYRKANDKSRCPYGLDLTIAAGEVFGFLGPNVLKRLPGLPEEPTPMFTLFVLSASYFLLSWLEKPRWQDMTAALLLFGIALLTKDLQIFLTIKRR